MTPRAKFLWSIWPCLAVAIGLWVFGNAWCAILLYHAPIILGLVLHRSTIRELYRGFRWLPTLAGIGIGLATIPTVIVCLPWLVGMEVGEVGSLLHEKLARTGLSAPWFFVFFAYFVLIHPILEELGWRSTLGSDSRKIHVLDVAFASYHLLVLPYFFPGAWPLFAVSLLALTGSAWLWRQMRREFGGLISVVIFHAAADAGILIAVWWLAFVAI